MKRTFSGAGMIGAIGWLSAIIPTLTKEKKYDVEIKEHRDRRSLRANNYAWELMEQIAAVLGEDKNEVYHTMLVSYGTCRRIDDEVYTISMPSYIELSLRTDEYLYIHTAFIGESEAGGRLFNHYRILKGSSEYDTKEMSVFIDGIVREAQQLDIETRTPDEIALMKSRWRG